MGYRYIIIIWLVALLTIKCRAKGRTSTDVTGLRYNNNAFYQNDTKYNITTRQMLTFLV